MGLSLSLKNYPNPAISYTNISFELTEAANTVVNICNLSGKIINTVVDDFLPAGEHEFTWYLNNGSGTRVNPGIYICSVQSGNLSNSIKILVE
jgi:flagellar hook assembly protein FlgD